MELCGDLMACHDDFMGLYGDYRRDLTNKDWDLISKNGDLMVISLNEPRSTAVIGLV